MVYNATCLFMRYLFFVLSMLLGLNLSAGHIMGGEMFYQYLGNNQYQITVRQFLQTGDIAGTAFAAADPYINIIIYDGSGNNLIQTLTINQGNLVTFSNNKEDPCTGAQFDIIEAQAVDFVETVTLPPIAGGYLLTYFRCCRKDDMTNMMADQGYGIEVFIPDETIAPENNLPVFSNVPPTFICVGDSFRYDQHATDLDGDQLVYSICETKVAGDPYTAIYFDPAFDVTPASHTFYSNAIWNPGYSAADPLGNGSVSINPSTGEISGYADAVGKFVISICVSEYRNGVLLNTVIRDFLVVATEDCPDFTAGELSTGANFYPDVCGNRATFENNSRNATHYFWDFGVEEDEADTSVAKEPVYSYRESGVYTVTFVAFDSISDCSDTIIATVDIEMPDASFTFSGICKDDPITFVNSSNSADNSALSFIEYYFGDGDSTGKINPNQTVAHTYPKSGVWNVAIIAYDTACGIDTAFQAILVPQTALADFSLSKEVGYPEEAIDITNNSMHYQSLDWDFGGIQMTGDLQGELDLGLESGTYEFILTANDANPDCTTRDTVIYKVSNAGFAVPNAFSPNGDGKNDYFRVLATDVIDYYLVIYNRWGEKVFDSNDPSETWDGKYKGKYVQPGMYPYECTAKNADTGTPFDVFKGSILVIR